LVRLFKGWPRPAEIQLELIQGSEILELRFLFTQAADVPGDLERRLKTLDSCEQLSLHPEGIAKIAKGLGLARPVAGFPEHADRLLELWRRLGEVPLHAENAREIIQRRGFAPAILDSTVEIQLFRKALLSAG